MSSYAQIATIYDADMGLSMRLPDVAYYLAAARRVSGPVLELGCGTGRILGPLLAAGIRAVGVDRCAAMLQQARLRLGADAPLLQMDIRQLALRRRFALALLPYSLVTYLLDDEHWQALARGLRGCLLPGAEVLLDAFVPQPGLPGVGWLRDYARPCGQRWLVRHKRITRLADENHRIERRYRLAGAFDGHTLSTCEIIRPYTPQQLDALAVRHLGRIVSRDYDYGTRANADGARHYSLRVRIGMKR